MAHCPYEKLGDLEDQLAKIRTWPLVKEKSPGVFYIKSLPFLHFHVKAERRWADARDGKNWGERIDVPFAAKVTAKRAFLKEVERRYRSLADV